MLQINSSDSEHLGCSNYNVVTVKGLRIKKMQV